MQPDPAFVRLVDAHYEALYRFALSLARREADACDLVQQTFFVWAKKGHGLREADKAKSWLFTTLYREFLRARRRGLRGSSLEDLPPAQQEPADEAGQTDFERLDGEAVMAALQAVEELFRAPLALFYLEDLSYLEIAEALDLPVGTVMSRLSRGKAHLRARLATRLTAADQKVIPFTQSSARKGAAS